MGSDHYDISQRELTGLHLDEAMPPERAAEVRRFYLTAVSSGRPVLAGETHTDADGSRRIVHHRLLLPLAADGRTVDTLLGYLHVG